jgi:hypothetical protein
MATSDHQTGPQPWHKALRSPAGPQPVAHRVGGDPHASPRHRPVGRGHSHRADNKSKAVQARLRPPSSQRCGEPEYGPSRGAHVGQRACCRLCDCGLQIRPASLPKFVNTIMARFALAHGLPGHLDGFGGVGARLPAGHKGYGRSLLRAVYGMGEACFGGPDSGRWCAGVGLRIEIGDGTPRPRRLPESAAPETTPSAGCSGAFHTAPPNNPHRSPKFASRASPVSRVLPRVVRGRTAPGYRSGGRCRGRGRRASGVDTPGEPSGRSRLRRRVRPLIHHPRRRM